jgi:metal-sulfur cluster biosynthetic enzyme
MEEDEIRAALKQVIDPEIGINIVDLGLVYGIEQNAERVALRVTMTTPTCPLGEHITEEIERVLRRIEPERRIEVALVWEPAWSPEMMSAEARRLMGDGPAAPRPPRKGGIRDFLRQWGGSR